MRGDEQVGGVRGGRLNYSDPLPTSRPLVSALHAVKSAPRPPVALPSTHLTACPARRGHSPFKNYCAKRRKNTPKKTRARTRCRYCEDKRAGVHWTKRNKKGCARIPGFCVTKIYAPRKAGEHARSLPVPSFASVLSFSSLCAPRRRAHERFPAARARGPTVCPGPPLVTQERCRRRSRRRCRHTSPPCSRC